MKYYDPHWKPDRDHKKIVADKKLDKQIAKDVREHFTKHPYKPVEESGEMGSFIGFGARYTTSAGEAARRRARLKRRRGAKPTYIAAAGRQQDQAVGAGSARSAKTRLKRQKPKDDHSQRIGVIASELKQIEEKLEKLNGEQGRTFDKQRQSLLGERIGHLITRRSKLRDEQHRLS